MKDKKKIIIITFIILVFILLGIGLYFYLKPNYNYNLSDLLNNMKNLESYKVVVNKNNLRFDEDEVVLENIINKDVEKITDHWGTRYFYNNKIVKSKEYGDGKIWYYEREWGFSSVTPSFKGVYDEMFDILSKYKFSQKKNVFQFVNEKYIDEDGDEREKILDLDEELEDIIVAIANISYDSSIYAEDGEYKLVPVLGDVSISLNKDKINKVTLLLLSQCYDEENELIDCSELLQDKELYKIVIDFSNYGTAKIDFPKNFESDLQKTTAGNWVGTYKGTMTCSDGKKYEETVNLTSDVEIDGKIFWEVSYKVFDCETSRYSQSSTYYTHENNKIVLYNFFKEEVLTEFELNENKLIEKDENGNIISEFKKENSMN